MIKEEADKFCDVVEDIYLTGEATIEWPFESDFTAGSGVICLSCHSCIKIFFSLSIRTDPVQWQPEDCVFLP